MDFREFFILLASAAIIFWTAIFATVAVYVMRTAYEARKLISELKRGGVIFWSFKKLLKAITKKYYV